MSAEIETQNQGIFGSVKGAFTAVKDAIMGSEENTDPNNSDRQIAALRANSAQREALGKIRTLGLEALGKNFFQLRESLTESEITELKREFDRLDTDRDGFITESELRNISNFGERADVSKFDSSVKSVFGPSETITFPEFLEILSKSRKSAGQGNFLKHEHILRREIYSNEEILSLVQFINIMLDGNQFIEGILPLSEKDSNLWNELRDGGIFCKLVNRIQPGTIDEFNFNFERKLHFLQMIENQMKVLQGASSIGANVRSIGARELASGDQKSILALLEQLFRLVISKDIHSFNLSSDALSIKEYNRGKSFSPTPTPRPTPISQPRGIEQVHVLPQEIQREIKSQQKPEVREQVLNQIRQQRRPMRNVRRPTRMPRALLRDIETQQKPEVRQALLQQIREQPNLHGVEQPHFMPENLLRQIRERQRPEVRQDLLRQIREQPKLRGSRARMPRNLLRDIERRQRPEVRQELLRQIREQPSLRGTRSRMPSNLLRDIEGRQRPQVPQNLLREIRSYPGLTKIGKRSQMPRELLREIETPRKHAKTSSSIPEVGISLMPDRPAEKTVLPSIATETRSVPAPVPVAAPSVMRPVSIPAERSVPVAAPVALAPAPVALAPTPIATTSSIPAEQEVQNLMSRIKNLESQLEASRQPALRGASSSADQDRLERELRHQRELKAQLDDAIRESRLASSMLHRERQGRMDLSSKMIERERFLANTSSIEVPTSGVASPDREGEAFMKGILRWKRVWLSLKDNYLFIFKSQESQKIRNSVNLTNAEVTRCPEVSKDNALKISLGKHDNVYLAFHNQEALNEWFGSIISAQEKIAPIVSQSRQVETLPVSTSSTTASSVPLSSSGSNFPVSHDLKSETAIFDAAALGDEHWMNSLLDSNADLLRKNSWGATPLHVAASRGHFRMVERLLDVLQSRNQLSNVLNLQSEYDLNTPLHLAARGGFADVCSLLLARGATNGVLNLHSQTPADIANLSEEEKLRLFGRITVSYIQPQTMGAKVAPTTSTTGQSGIESSF